LKLPLQVGRYFYIVKGFIVKVNHFAAFYTEKMLVVLHPTVKSAWLARALDLERNSDLGQSQQGAVDRIQRDTADVSPHHFVDFLGCGG
jgi:hypothetical protein